MLAEHSLLETFFCVPQKTRTPRSAEIFSRPRPNDRVDILDCSWVPKAPYTKMNPNIDVFNPRVKTDLP